jgi:hypothetical protein
MSLKNPNATKKPARLLHAPLPAVFANMSPQQVYNGNQSGDQLQSWQEGYTSGYKTGHLEGWDASTNINYQKGVNSGFVLGAKMLVEGDNFSIVNKNNLSDVISAPTLDDLILKIPHEGERNLFRPNEAAGWYSKSEIYAKNSAFIRSADDNYVYLDVAKIRGRVQDMDGMIKGKYFRAAAKGDGYEIKTTLEDFQMLIGSIIKPAPARTHKKPKKDAIMKQIEGVPRTPKKGKK